MSAAELTTTTDIDDVLDAIRDLTRAVRALCEAQDDKNKILDEIHAACTATKPKSELEPWMQKIAEACSDTADGMSQLVEGIEATPARVVALLEVEPDADPS